MSMQNGDSSHSSSRTDDNQSDDEDDNEDAEICVDEPDSDDLHEPEIHTRLSRTPEGIYVTGSYFCRVNM